MKSVPHAVPDDYDLVFYLHQRVRVRHATNPRIFRQRVKIKHCVWLEPATHACVPQLRASREEIEVPGIKPPGIDRREFSWRVEVRIHGYPSAH